MDSRLKEWWEAVDAQRKEKYGTGGPADEPMEKVPQTQNEYAAELMKGI